MSTQDERTRLDFDHTNENERHCGFAIGPVMGGDEVESLTFEFSGLEGEPPTSRDAALLRRWQREYEGALIARALRVATDAELDAAGLARVDDGPHSKRHGMYKTALLRIDNKAKSLDEAKTLAGRALYGDLP